MGNRGSEAGARACKGFAKPRGFGPGLASRVVRHVERDFGRFVVWHVEVEPTVPRFSPNYKTNAAHSVIIQLVDVPPSSPAITVVANLPPAFHESSVLSPGRSICLAEITKPNKRLLLCTSDSLSRLVVDVRVPPVACSGTTARGNDSSTTRALTGWPCICVSIRVSSMHTRSDDFHAFCARFRNFLRMVLCEIIKSRHACISHGIESHTRCFLR